MPQAAWYIAQFAFWAGVYWAFARQTRKDVDGIGVKTRQIERKIERRNKQLLAALIQSAQIDEDVKRFADLLRDDSWDEP